MISELIDSPDLSEVVRDTVYAILQAEQAAQVALATSAGKANPNEWALEVHRETVDVADYIDSPGDAPLVIVTLDEMNRDPNNTTASGIYKFETTILIDVVGVASASGTNSATLESKLKVNRGVRLVRQILSAAEYTRLGLRTGMVDSRKIEYVKFNPPDFGGLSGVASATIRMTVKLNETGPQSAGNILNLITTETKRADDGFTLFDATFGGP